MLRIIKNIFLFIVTFGITLFVSDLFIKYAGISQVLIYEYDKYLGRVFMKNAEYTMTTEGFAMGNINEYGYIGRGYGKEKAPGMLRIALLGDSYIEGFQHFDKNHFRTVLEKELKQIYGINSEVMNFGRFGYNLLNMYVIDKNFVSEFNPDITLFFLSAEDFIDTTTQQWLPQPYLENDSLKILYMEPPQSRRPWFLDRNQLSKVSPVMMMVRNCMTLHGKGQTPSILLGKFARLAGIDPVENKKTDENDLPALQIKIFNELAKKKGNIIVYRELDEPPAWLKKDVKNTGIPFIPLSNAVDMQKQNNTQLYFKDSNGYEGHWNMTAHNAIGIYLAKFIAENWNR